MGDALSRFQYLQKPVMAPGHCICCGSVSKPVIDFGKSDDWYGAVYFCRDCVVEAAMQTGEVVTIAQYTELEGRLVSAEQAIDPVFNLVKRHHRDQRDLAHRFFGDLASILNGSDDVDADEISSGVESDVPADDPGEPKTSGQESRATKHKRSVSVPSDPDDVLGLG